MSTESTKLTAGLAELGLSLSAGQQEKMLRFVGLLVKWNKVYNLTSVREPVDMVSRHLLDSLTPLHHIADSRMVDIGCGAGLPGIPLAIARPQIECTLLDSNGKKTRFVQQAVSELSLQNATVKQARVENAELSPFDTVISRAFSSPVDILERCGHLCREKGSFVFMLGHVNKLLGSLPKSYKLDSLEPVSVPFEEGIRHIAVIKKL